MHIPEGLTEAQVLEIIRKTVAYLSPSFKFGYFDIDDMKQEGTIFCLEALPSFNFDKSCQTEVRDALFTFLKTHVRWRFLNMRRKQLARLEPPLCDCDLCKNDSANRLDCKKYSNWVRRNMAKRSLMEPFDVGEVYSQSASSTQNIDELLISSDIISILNEHIPASSRVDYRKFIEGVALPKNKKEKLIEQIRAILDKHWGKNENG